jgi:cellulose synthase/poly-beta-1,6-N-acetylglucosamine synthase-like glycosyltransferase
MPDRAFGVVAIGRNEGARLGACLRSVASLAGAVVYVDSGSTDGSTELAQRLGVACVTLDPGVPFTAALARNEGFRHLRLIAPDLAYVQFVDGDCEVAQGWPGHAARFLDAHPEVAAVCGRRRERFPDDSVYNMLCDIEWDTPVGEARACGGDAMMRCDAFEAVGGFRAGLIAGEEPELCVRLRAAGWRIWRLAEEMTLHDAAMQRIGQWWKRTLRGGYAYAQGADLHGAPPERHWVRESRSAWFWALGVPLAALGLAFFSVPAAAAVLLVYPLQVLRLFLRGTRTPRQDFWRALFLVLGKFPELLGQLKFMLRRQAGGPPRLIEYK